MKSTYKLTAVFTAVIILVVGVSYFWASSSLDEKNDKISSLQEDINSKENEIASLESSVTSKENEIASLESSIGDISNFERMLLKGLEIEQDGLINLGYAESDYDDFLRSHDNLRLGIAKMYANSFSIYYSYAKGNMEDAKSRYELARKYAPSEKYLRLIDNHIKACEYAIQIYNEMEQAGGDFASACEMEGYSAYQTEWAKANAHISASDNLVENYNTCLSNIDVLLDDW